MNRKAFGKALIIGLGGTGQKALLQIKKNFQDNCEGKVPPSIKFLSFDTDQPEPSPMRDVHGNVVELTDGEFCKLTVGLVREAIRSPYVQKWWISFPPLDNTAINSGAGGIREAGRLALFSCIDQVRGRIETAYNEINRYGIQVAMESAGFRLLPEAPQAIVVGSLAGGTGGGLFFDVSILCRALGGGTSKYMAYIMMPWVYKHLANSAYENTYAGLVELNHLSELTVDRPLRIQYSDTLECTLVECPYHIVNLVDAQCDNGERITNDKELTSFIAESIYHLTGALGAPAKSVYDNIIALRNSVNNLNSTDWGGKNAIFSTIGVANIRFPAEEWHQYFSHLRTSELLRLIATEVDSKKSPEPVNGNLPTDLDIDALIDLHKLKPTQEAMLAAILPEGRVPSVSVGDDELEGVATRQEVEQLLKERVVVARKDFADELDKISVKFRGNAEQAVLQLLGQREESKRPETCRILRAHFKAAQEALVVLNKARNQTMVTARQDVDRAIDQMPAEFKFVHKFTGAFKSRAKNLAEKMSDQLGVECQGECINRGLEIVEKLLNSLGDFQKQHNVSVNESEKLAMDLRGRADMIESAAEAFRPKKGSSQRRFEILVGVDNSPKPDTTYNCFEKTRPLPDTAELRKRLPAVLATADDGKGGAVQKYVGEVFQWVSGECKGILSNTALDAIKAMREVCGMKTDEEMVHSLMERAIGQSTLLLPLHNELLAQNSHSVKEFLVIGLGSSLAKSDGKQPNQDLDDEKMIMLSLAPDQRERTRITQTAEPYLIAITRYKAIFPLHAIQGVAAMRREYQDRFLPPSHIDRQKLFVLDDPMPQDHSHPTTLKLLTLSMFDCFQLISHRHDDARGGSRFVHNGEELKHDYLVSFEAEQKLPGKPGKFYSLVEDLSQKHFDGLREEIRAALKRLAAQKVASTPKFLDQFFAEVNMKQRCFQAIVENMVSGARLESLSIEFGTDQDKIRGRFNKTITGQYYRRQAEFLRRVLAGEDGLRKALLNNKEADLIELILDAKKGFKI